MSYRDDLEELVLVNVETLNDAVTNIANMAYGHGYQVMLFTRKGVGDAQMVAKLVTEAGINYDSLCIGYESRADLFEERIKDRYNVKYVIDTSGDSVWYDKNITVLATVLV